MTTSACTCRAGPRGPLARRPIRSSYRPRPVLLGAWVQARYLAGGLSLAEAREIIPGFLPEIATFAQLNEILAADRSRSDTHAEPAPCPAPEHR